MNFNDIRKLFLEYFEKRGHVIVPSASLIPDDPTVLFTVAGMVPWKKILQGIEMPFAPRVADAQKCLRAGGKHNDLEDVGYDGRHHTFFEMLGNWSFGDYFKDGAIEMSWDLLTRELKLDPARIIVTTHTSDDEATALWKKIAGKDAIRLGDKSNWWAAGDTGPCGPCTEMFYDFGADVPGGLPGTPDEDGGRYVEIWNDVFMQFDRDAAGTLTPLPKQNVDTGAGLERWAAMLAGTPDNYNTDLFHALIFAAESFTGVKKNAENTPSFKIITDHLRAVGFAIADGVTPSNEGRGYVIRRILRRAMRHGQMIGHRGELLSALYPALVEQMGDAYPELSRESARVIETIKNEEHSFSEMLENGMKLLESSVVVLSSPRRRGRQSSVLPGAAAFKLYDTYGFPLDLTQMILRDRGMDVDVPGFEAAMAEQKERSRADTKGTKTLWESRTDLSRTDDSGKYGRSYNSLLGLGANNSPLGGSRRAVTRAGGGTSSVDNTVCPPTDADGTASFPPSREGQITPKGGVVSTESKGGGYQSSHVLAILHDGEFVNSVADGAEVEVVLDKTPFYATMGGQVGDAGIILKDDAPILNVSETFPVDGLVIHKGITVAPIAVGDAVRGRVDGNMREQIARAHTAAHLLQAALRRVLGGGVEQRGSKVSPDSVRFDFSFGRAMTHEELATVERFINEWIDLDLPVETIETDLETAKSMGAMALFGEKYHDKVRVVSVSPSLRGSGREATEGEFPPVADDPATAPLKKGGTGTVSCELCGGTHATHTGQIIRAKINKEKSIASGIRRITMSVGDMA